ncbi:hypothetical protein, partial [Actinomadura geliboluensis]|uniref:hypothetical protein n=1 Tax=Actinomadura geliboluensis TaxID=882440 RepID=UPI003684C08D
MGTDRVQHDVQPALRRQLRKTGTENRAGRAVADLRLRPIRPALRRPQHPQSRRQDVTGPAKPGGVDSCRYEEGPVGVVGEVEQAERVPAGEGIETAPNQTCAV